MHSPELGDYIGGESCFDLKPDVADIPSRSAGKNRPRRWNGRHAAAEVEYPPPIQQSPWVMKKYRTSDGRLVIKEEKVKRRHYFQAHRSDGRLLLNLVEELNCPENMDGGDDGAVSNIDPTVEEVVSHDQCYTYSEIGVVNPCGGFGVPVAVAAFRPPVLT